MGNTQKSKMNRFCFRIYFLRECLLGTSLGKYCVFSLILAIAAMSWRQDSIKNCVALSKIKTIAESVERSVWDKKKNGNSCHSHKKIKYNKSKKKLNLLRHAYS